MELEKWEAHRGRDLEGKGEISKQKGGTHLQTVTHTARTHRCTHTLSHHD
ncbi:hypothetical protein EXN66_Car003647 [Channa argus]|uniref:Uncharacterized protein n=1 Tax=Channa argus TaxID=215402 RepID=A0A6G1PCJ4_CHAAH|nr:hypothetical protein EXN66_Car003647 [Channa argus]